MLNEHYSLLMHTFTHLHA